MESGEWREKALIRHTPLVADKEGVMMCIGGFYPKCGFGFDAWILLTFLLLLMLIIKRSRAMHKGYEEMYERTCVNQKEMISLLKEIRDSLKK